MNHLKSRAERRRQQAGNRRPCVGHRHAHMKGDLRSETFMRLIIAILLPFLAFFTIGRPIAGIICLILQVTLIGWLPAAIWAVYALGQYNTDKKIRVALADRHR